MKLRALLTGGVSLLGATTLSVAQLTPDPARPVPAAAIPDEYLVQVKAGVNPRLVAPAHGIAPRHVYQSAVNGFAGKVPPGRLAALMADPRVVLVVPDRSVAANAKPGAGGASAPQVVPAGIQRIGAAPGLLKYSGAGIGVAVVDTGIDANHADLKPLGVGSFSAFGGSAQDTNGHGTHVAGTIAAHHNSIDVVGVAPLATLYAVKVLDAAGNGSDATVTAGLNWVAANAGVVVPAIRVVNMSLGRAGTLEDNPMLRAAVHSLVTNGITVIVAAGNDASLEVSEQVPSTYPEVIAVASTTAKAGTNQSRLFNGTIAADTASYFTSDGAFDSTSGIGVTISAPGEDAENISKAGFLESVGILSTKLGGGTIRMSGTSMAAPHAAGVAALIWDKALSLGSDASSEDVRACIRAGAQNEAAPLNSPANSYTYDGVNEGVLYAPEALSY